MNPHFTFRIVLLCALLLVASPVFAGFDEALSGTPKAWQQGQWQITPLQTSDDRLYYRAHQGSADYLYHVLGWSWPTKKISPEVNADMVRHHVAQHERKAAFTYVVRHTGEEGILGAIYLTPVNMERRHVPNFNPNEFSAEVTFWFTQGAESADDSERLLQELIMWLTEEWPQAKVLMPVHSDYTFVHEQMLALEHEPFTEDAETGDLLYRLP
ncbi:hypothetical protein CWE15_08165 [Aliidiomarina taiwanensis]|uniref:GNAT family N-acetyltransferase n=1 Tax=Aliidiomarina taiwanensis TaxID=946228 RepID=A0A432X1E5_9GAMM|nr:hypothetical protein [Aliidiomarina taiwanensis]RUO40109.1 hypothetical protein CWE15_08165 [Aliidiomarina taiwanensis]